MCFSDALIGPVNFRSTMVLSECQCKVPLSPLKGHKGPVGAPKFLCYRCSFVCPGHIRLSRNLQGF
jgi:hypothetical protein